jgi:hypothetical protein
MGLSNAYDAARLAAIKDRLETAKRPAESIATVQNPIRESGERIQNRILESRLRNRGPENLAGSQTCPPERWSPLAARA